MLFLRPGFTDTLRHMVPATTPYREFTAAGGLMSYGASIPDAHRWRCIDFTQLFSQLVLNQPILFQ
jgi:hypothetical protein